MTINPKVGMWLSIGLAIISYLVGASSLLTTIFGEHTTVILLASMTLLLGAGNTVNAVLHMIPSQPGAAGAAEFPLGPPTSSTASKSAAVLAILILGALIVPTPGYAQTRPLTGNIIGDIQRAKAGSGPVTLGLGDGDLMTKLAKPFQDLAQFLSDDAAGAIALSTQIPALQDGHGQQCWIAMSTAGDVFKAHPVPLTLKVMTDVEALRLLAMTANNLCSNVHCTQVFADLTTMAQAASPTPLPIPGLHDLCSKIPQIALAAPVTPPTPPVPATGTVTTPPALPAQP